MVDTLAVTDYLARVVRRGRLDEVEFKDSPYVAATEGEVRGGSLTREHADALFSAHDAAAGRRGRGAAPSSSATTATALASAASAAPATAKAVAETRPERSEAGAAASPTDGSTGGASDDAGSWDDDGPPLSVVIAPISLELRDGGHTGLLLLEAQLFRDGRLVPILETASSPWIPSERLSSPMVGDREVMVGELSQFWAYSRRELGAEISRAASMADALDLARGLFEDVAGESVEEFAAHEPGTSRVEHELCFVRELDRVNAVGGLLDVYDHVATHGAPPLLDRLCQGWRGARISERAIHEGDGLAETMTLSCGSMSDGFPLTPSQRRAVHAFLSGTDGDVTAVSGPPGTGKTTMLQAVVANMLTRRALDGEDAPVIVGTSTNNQAVTNIISSFSSVTKNEPGTLDLRWLPGVENGRAAPDTPLRSLAVYCPASSRLAEARARYLVEQTNKSGTYTDFSDPGYLEDAKTAFVMRASAYFGHAHDIAGIQGWISDALAEVDALRTALIEEMSRHGASSRYAALCARAEASPHLAEVAGVAALAACTDLPELDAALDTTLRYAEFWLAVHYYESRWLLTEDFVAPEDRFKNTARVMSTYWPQAAALTPCFVMTAYQVPRYFSLWTKNGEPAAFDTGRIDLLIVDEAGQVDTPIGLPAFALASRALVVGDEKQLAPVWSIDEETDREVAAGAGISAAEWTEDLKVRGLTCSPHSSLMRAASHASLWCYDDGAPGLFLSEHFRCHPDIIGYCNDLLYHGLLEPKRPASASRIEGPAFLFTEVPGSHDVTHGSSRQNQAEAEFVARWLVTTYGHLRDLYITREPDPEKAPAEDELIAVVTPFSAQARLITRELRRAASSSEAPADLPARFAEKITVGTAHRLQGAERPVVLFSAVYGQNSGRAGFIDANPELMNVAVSRAKDLFIVCAAANRWDNGPVFEAMTPVAHRSDARFGAAEEPSSQTSDVPDALLAGTAGALDAAQVPDAAPAPESQSSPGADVPPGAGAVPDPGATPGTDSGDVGPGTTAPDVVAGPALGAGADDGPPSTPLTLTALLAQWREHGMLTEDDAALATSAWNLRLAEAGVLEGETGAWEPTALAGRLGVLTEQRRGAKGQEYTAIMYTPRMRMLLEELYREGLL